MAEEHSHSALATNLGVTNPRAGSEGFRGPAVFWPLLVAAVIFLASSRSHVATPGVTRIDDKFAHFGVYGLLATLLCRLGGGWRGAIPALIATSLYGASDEWHQSFVPGRSTDVNDWLADTIGAALAIALYRGWPAYRKLMERPLGRRVRIENT